VHNRLAVILVLGTTHRRCDIPLHLPLGAGKLSMFLAGPSYDRIVPEETAKARLGAKLEMRAKGEMSCFV